MDELKKAGAEKVLLVNYECSLGKADKITQQNGKLLFYNSTREFKT